MNIPVNKSQFCRYNGSGQVAVQLDESGCGFCYYESGRVAVCVNRVSSYQRSFQFYEDNTKKTVLATMNEHAIGSAIGESKGKILKLLLTKDGGLILNAQDDSIINAWRWDRKAQKAGTQPTTPVSLTLNDSLLFTYKDRSTIAVQFQPIPNICVEFDCGEQLRRTDTYLDHAHRETQGPQRGKLMIDQDTPTLQDRHRMKEQESIEKRSKQRPRSQDLGHSEIKSIVMGLEHRFDKYEGCKVSAAMKDAGWKTNAKIASLREIPRLPKTGTEVGMEPTLFGAPIEVNDNRATLSRLQNAERHDEWLGSVEVRNRIAQENPILARTGPLTNASGRYTRELTVTGYVHGQKPSTTDPLTSISGTQLDRFLCETCRSDELVVIACLRADDHQSRTVEMTLGQVQHRLHELVNSTTNSGLHDIANKCRLVKCDLAESSALSDRYRIHAVPTFLIFYNSKLVHVSSLGGARLRVIPATTNPSLSHLMDQLPRVLLVENKVKNQVAIEKMLRKEHFQCDLAISGEQATAFWTRVPMNIATSVYGLVMLSDTLEDGAYRSIDRLVRSSKDKSRMGGTLVSVIVSSTQVDVTFSSTMCIDCRRGQGRRISDAVVAATTSSSFALACPHCGIISVSTDYRTLLVSPIISEVAQILVYKHVKAATLHRLAEAWLTRQQESQRQQETSCDGFNHDTGLTVESFFREMEKHYTNAKQGQFLPDQYVPPMAISTTDVTLFKGHS